MTVERMESERVSGRTNGSEAPASAPAEASIARVQLRRLAEDRIFIPIRGLMPYIPQRWSEKAKAQIRGKQTQGARAGAPRELKDPKQARHDATYWLAPERPGMPAVAFKAAMVGACRFFPGITLVEAKNLFFVVGQGPEQLVPFEYEERGEREDLPRIAMGTTDLRYRYEFRNWHTILEVTYLSEIIDRDSVVNLVDAAGRLGIGEMRPSAPKSFTGQYGTWRVELDEENDS